MIEEIEDTIKWKIVITSFAKKESLSDKQLDSIFNCYKHKEYQSFRNEMIEKDKMYDEYPVGKWQLQKAREIEELWHNSIDYTINDDIVKVCINLEIDYPVSFDKGDVSIWTEGLSRLNKIYLMVQMKDLIDGISINEDENDFLNELFDNENINIIKIES